MEQKLIPAVFDDKDLICDGNVWDNIFSNCDGVISTNDGRRAYASKRNFFWKGEIFYNTITIIGESFITIQDVNDIIDALNDMVDENKDNNLICKTELSYSPFKITARLYHDANRY